MMTRDFASLTKDWALDVLVERIGKKWPGIDLAKERAVLARKSRAQLLHDVGAQLHGDLAQFDEQLTAYAFGRMTADEQRTIRQAG